MRRDAVQILKVDVTGRVWTPPERREAVLDEFERSGMPATKFAEHIGVKYPTFASWRQKRRRSRGEAKPIATSERAALRWVEATVAEGGGREPLVVQLPGGARMEVGNEAQVVLAAELLRRLLAGTARC